MTFDWTIKITDIAIVFATIGGPILAVQAQKWLEKGREIKQRRALIFRTLMATRATTLSQAHVEALNAVPIEFYGNEKALKVIINKWKIYLDHLHKDTTVPEWETKRAGLLVELIHEMAEYLGYEFNTVEIANEVYIPQGHAWIQSDQDLIRRGLALLLSGQLALPMDVRSLPTDQTNLAEQDELRKLLLRWLNGEATVSVDIKSTGQPEKK